MSQGHLVLVDKLISTKIPIPFFNWWCIQIKDSLADIKLCTYFIKANLYVIFALKNEFFGG